MKVQFTSSAPVSQLAVIKRYMNQQGILPPSDAALVRWGIELLSKSVLESYPNLAFNKDEDALKYLRGIKVEDAEAINLQPSSLISQEELAGIIRRITDEKM